MTGLDSLFSLKGRRALVTGGAGPLGRVLAGTLAAQGADVVVSDVAADACEDVAGQLAREYGVQAMAVAVNLLEDGEQLNWPEPSTGHWTSL